MKIWGKFTQLCPCFGARRSLSLNPIVLPTIPCFLSSKSKMFKIHFRIRFATAKPCFALQFLPPTSGRNCAATRATPSEVLGWSRANSANAYWTLHTITLAHTILGASGHLRSYKTSSVLRMKAYSVMNAKVCTFLSCHCKICEEYFSAVCTFSCSMNESFQNESTCWAESRKPDCGVANSMEEQQCQSCD